MKPDPDFLAAARSDEELTQRVENREKYMPETILASLKELQYRGMEFSDEEQKSIRFDLGESYARIAALKGSVGIFDNDYKAAIVEDPDAPQLYTPVAIYLFTILAGPFFGAIMMAVNIIKIGKNNSAAAGVVVFGIGFTILQLWLLSNAGNGKAPGVLMLGIACAYCFNYMFWKPYIGFYIFYRKSPIWVPLIVAVAVWIITILLIHYGTASIRSLRGN